MEKPAEGKTCRRCFRRSDSGWHPAMAGVVLYGYRLVPVQMRCQLIPGHEQDPAMLLAE